MIDSGWTTHTVFPFLSLVLFGLCEVFGGYVCYEASSMLYSASNREFG